MGGHVPRCADRCRETGLGRWVGCRTYYARWRAMTPGAWSGAVVVVGGGGGEIQHVQKGVRRSGRRSGTSRRSGSSVPVVSHRSQTCRLYASDPAPDYSTSRQSSVTSQQSPVASRQSPVVSHQSIFLSRQFSVSNPQSSLTSQNL